MLVTTNNAQSSAANPQNNRSQPEDKNMQIQEHETETRAIELCLYPNEFCMPGSNLPFDCHTAEMAEALSEESEGALN